MSIAIVLSLAALAVALVGLAVAFATAARLRTAIESGGLAGMKAPQPQLPTADSVIGDFEIETLDGRTISQRDLHVDQQLIGFFSVGCAPCSEDLPNFLALEDKVVGDLPKPIAVINGEPDEAREYAKAFPDAFAVVIEPDSEAAGTLSAAVGVKAFPTYLLAEHGRVGMSAVRIKGIAA
ncbi:TlpA disulfide reductase family protein [Actinoplanes sp. NPDC051861]|uniref:TlpA disulfide reductase family protein n=1 Tax=Actinoplanes sp. NPDC051861 TaxID=3155170 RepID=UPI00343C0A35